MYFLIQHVLYPLHLAFSFSNNIMCGTIAMLRFFYSVVHILVYSIANIL